MPRAIGLEVSIRHLKRSARGIDSCYLTANPSQVQGKAALVAAHVQCASGGAQPARPALSGGIVCALVQESSRFLPGVGVVIEGQPIQPKLSTAGNFAGFCGPKRLSLGGG